MLIGKKTLKLKRDEFLKACNVRGRNVRYYEPLDPYQPTLWNEWHEGHERYKEAVVTKVLWHEHLNKWTLKRIGMVQVLGTDHPFATLGFNYYETKIVLGEETYIGVLNIGL